MPPNTKEGVLVRWYLVPISRTKKVDWLEMAQRRLEQAQGPHTWVQTRAQLRRVTKNTLLASASRNKEASIPGAEPPVYTYIGT